MTAAEIAKLISQYRFNFMTESDLQDGLLELLKTEPIKIAKEEFISRKSRPDFIVEGNIAIEVKIGGSLGALTRQVQRYAKHDSIREVLVVTSKSRHTNLPATLAGKPVTVINVSKAV